MQNQRRHDPTRASQEKRSLRFCRSKQQKMGLNSSLFRRAQATSNRSWSMTLLHAATKSFTNFFLKSAHA